MMTESSSHAYVERIFDPMICLLRAGLAPRSLRAFARGLALGTGALLGLVTPLRADPVEGNPPPPIVVDVSGVVSAPVEEVRAVLRDLEGFADWFPATSEWVVLRDWEQGVARVYGRQGLPWPVQDRDYVVEYRWQESAEGFSLRASALRGAEPAPEGRVVRIEQMETAWTVRGSEAGTEVRYRYEGDAGGRLPDWVAQAGWRAQTPIVIERLREALGRRQGRTARPTEAAAPSAPHEARPEREGQ